MKKMLLTVVLVALCASACCSSKGGSGKQSLFDLDKVNSGPTIVTVNDIKIHQGLLDVLSEMNPRIQSQLANPLTRKKILDSLVEQQLLYQEAVKRGLGDNDAVEMKSLLNRHVIVSNELIQSETDKAMQKTYDERKDSQFTKISVSLIAAAFAPDTAKKDKKTDTAPTQAQKEAALAKIKTVKARLAKGDDFAKVAEEASDDKTTAKKGGAAGKIAKDDNRFNRLGYKKLIETAFAMKNGDVSDPIELANGYYIIKVTSDPTVVPFEEAKKVLGFELSSTTKTALLDQLKKGAKIEFSANEPKLPAPPVQKPEATAPTANTDPTTEPGTPVAAPTTTDQPASNGQ